MAARSAEHLLWLVLLSLLLLVSPQPASKGPAPWQSLTGFTCQGTNYNQALGNCPDKGAQKLSSGGNVTVFVKAAYNLPNMDFSGPAALVSDPYVKFSVGGSEVGRTRFIRNNLNPVWNEKVNLGVLASATEIQVEIWDYDIGVELDDDLLVRAPMRVPYCSMFHANLTSVDCGMPFGCESKDSLWAAPTRLMCNESGIVSFVNGAKCFTDSGVCLLIDVIIVPFQMNVELINPRFIQNTPVVSVFGKTAPVTAPWTVTNHYGYPAIGDVSTVFSTSNMEASKMVGALMLQFRASDKAKGLSNQINFYASVNFPATVYVCRAEADNSNGVPAWLFSDGWSAANVSVNKLLVAGTQTYYGCFFKNVDGTTKNKWGGLKRNPLVFYTNTIPGHDQRQVTDLPFYTKMYTVLAIPRLVAEPDDNFNVIYDRDAFINSIGSYGLIWAWFMFIVARFLHKISFRIDRIESWLASRVLTGENKSILGALFLTYQSTPCNVEYRSHLFHAKNAILLLLAIPQLLLIGWGFSCVSMVRPTALGYGVAFLGMGGTFQWFGFRLWEHSGWRLSPLSVVSMGLAVIFFFVFIISTIFVDVAVVTYGFSLNVAALSLLFGTLNSVPLIFVLFREDKSHRNNLNAVLDKMTDAVVKMRKTERRGEFKECLPANKSLHSLLGAQYTINPKVPFFKMAAVLQEPDKKPTASDAEAAAAAAAAAAASADGKSDSSPSLDRDAMYDASLFILFVYLMIAIARTDRPSLAFLNCLAVLTFDVIHTSLASGDNKWSAGYKIVLLVCGRLLIMGSTPSLWLVNYSGAYLLYGVALMQEIINNSLPMLSKREAGEIAFAGKDDFGVRKSKDIASTAIFCFGWLTFVFACLILVSAFGNVSHSLPVPDIVVAKSPWHVYSFGVIAILLVITGGLLSATIRAFTWRSTDSCEAGPETRT